MLPKKSRVPICERNSSGDTKVSGKGGAVGAPSTCGENNSKAAVDLQPMDNHGDAEIHLQSMEETQTGADGCPREGCQPEEPHTRAGE